MICIYMFITYTSHMQTGATPLYIASQQGHCCTVDTLVRNGADSNQPKKVLRGIVQ